MEHAETFTGIGGFPEVDSAACSELLIINTAFSIRFDYSVVYSIVDSKVRGSRGLSVRI